MAIELFNHNGHVCLMFSHLSDEGGDAVQANQFLIVDHDEGVIMDPGGNMTYNELSLTMRKYIAPQHLDYIIASHADPDIIAALDAVQFAPTLAALDAIWESEAKKATVAKDKGGYAALRNACKERKAQLNNVTDVETA
jgi:flavorubredoxin